MYQKRSNLQNLIIITIDCIVLVISLGLANYIRHQKFFRGLNDPTDMKILILVFLIVFLVINLYKNFYKQMLLRGPFQELLEVVKMNLVTLAGASFVLYITRFIDEYSRVVLFLFVIIDVVLMFIVHQIYKKYLPLFYRISGTARQILLVATSDTAFQLVSEMRTIRDCSYEIKGIIVLDGADSADVAGIPVAGSRKDLVDYCLGASLDEVIISADGETEESLQEEMENIAAMGLTIHLQIPVLELKEAPQRMLSQFGKLHMIT
ncbi:MAG TPA: hypothetical protein H9717_04910, partial [Candidatus Eisenbergiella merdipullorum]|nr:hypothetical protein [Candidatus Eisenbergiella merdipullorum]